MVIGIGGQSLDYVCVKWAGKLSGYSMEVGE